MNAWGRLKNSFEIGGQADADQAASRHYRARLSIATNLASKATGLLILALGVGQTIGYLGAERFGAWMALASLTALLSFLDLGIANALVNRIAAAFVQGRPALRQVVSGGIGFLALIGLTVALCLHGVAAVLPWDRLVKVSDPAITMEVRHAAILMAWLFGVSLVTNGLQRIFWGLQVAHIAYLLATLTNLLVLGFLGCALRAQAGIADLLLVTFGVQVLAPLLLLALLQRETLLLPLRELWRAVCDVGRSLLHTGLIFFVLQIGSLVFMGFDSLILSSHLGAAATSEYAVLQRLFMCVSIPLMTFNANYWGGYADATVRGDQVFVQRTVRCNLLITLLLSICGGLALVTLGQSIVTLWTHGVVQPTMLVLSLFALLTVVDATGNAFAIFLNGSGIMKPQPVSVLILCLIALPAKLLLVDRYGVAGVLGASLVGYILSVPVYYGILIRWYRWGGFMRLGKMQI